ncbi:YcaO-like family protein [Streptomyces sp. NL15-2K]|nr:YcaO-like family protein [Kutzneria buriramensis]WKX10316.1 YcaO-like family protein [Kutzneria buriramensis]
MEKLVSPFGVLASAQPIDYTLPGEPKFAAFHSNAGWPLRLPLDSFRRIEEPVERSLFNKRHGGSGSALSPDHARLVALAEAAERYSCALPVEDAMFWATAAELGPDALELADLPRLSDEEYDTAGQQLRPPVDTEPIRWTAAWSVTRERRVYIPAVLAWTSLQPAHQAERITYPISTGYAVHTDLRAALSNALCECVERDAAAVLWLRRLPLPQVELDEVGPEPAAVLAQRRRSLLPDPLIFDATTELGIPTLYSLDVTPHNRKAAAAVAAATDPDPDRSLAKVLREGATCRTGLNRNTTRPRIPTGKHDVAGGALWMGQPDKLPEFDFLVTTPRRRRFSEIPRLPTADSFLTLCERLREHEMEVIAVEITPDDLRTVGLHSVRVIVPRLVPLTFDFNTRFLGHPRIWDADSRLGYPECGKNGVNPNPQPLA